jgi:hypothetical protein
MHTERKTHLVGDESERVLLWAQIDANPASLARAAKRSKPKVRGHRMPHVLRVAFVTDVMMSTVSCVATLMKEDQLDAADSIKESMIPHELEAMKWFQ